MLGFSAPWLGGEPRIGDEELQDARWFEREKIESAAAEDDDAGWGTPGDAGGPLKLPPRLAIARRLVEDWLLPARGWLACPFSCGVPGGVDLHGWPPSLRRRSPRRVAGVVLPPARRRR